MGIGVNSERRRWSSDETPPAPPTAAPRAAPCPPAAAAPPPAPIRPPPIVRWTGSYGLVQADKATLAPVSASGGNPGCADDVCSSSGRATGSRASQTARSFERQRAFRQYFRVSFLRRTQRGCAAD